MDKDLITYPTWVRYTILSNFVTSLSIRDRRYIFQLLRQTPDVHENLFFPGYGITLSEFAVWYTLDDHRRKGRKRKSPKDRKK